MKVLCVAEKPSIARAITQILSSNQSETRQTPNKYVKNFDFTYRLPPSTQLVRFTVTSVLGHLTESDFDPHYKNWSSCDPFALFDAPIIRSVSHEHKGIERNLQAEARTSDRLMIWTDCDREGEHIGSEIVSVCRKANRNIAVSRARFSAIIPAQIHNACRTAGELDMKQANAVETRMELDLRIGAALTRSQTLGLQPRFHQLQSVISYGPCQFPTLGFVVDQYDKVKAFVPEPFWYIHVTLEREDTSVEFKWKRNRLFDWHAAFALYEMCADDPEATIENISVKPATKWKPLPLTTVELQKSGSRLLHLTPKTILDLAEKLYTKGLVSYPRTETDQFDPAFDHQTLIDKQITDPTWGGFAARLKNDGEFQVPRNGKKNDKAHPPIHPTAHANNLTADEKRVYELITRRYLACCSKNATGKTTTIDVVITEEQFTATGLVILERNYLDVYIYDRWSGHTLPDFQLGEKFMPSVCELNEGSTTRPNLLTEADLVGLMDKNGIGTDATIAEHIAKIIEREYVFKTREGNVQYLVPSTLGIGLVEGYNAIGLDKSLSKPQLRRETEHRMSMICEGTKSKGEVLDQTIEEYREVFMRTKHAFNTLVETVGKYINPPDDEGENQIDGPDGGGGGPGGGGRGNQNGRGGRGGGNNRRGNPRGGGPGRGGGPARGGGGNDSDSDDDDDQPAGGRGGAVRGRGASRGSRAVTRPATSRTRTTNGSTAQSTMQNADAAEKDKPLCKCGDEVVERTVVKEGPNKGRKFYACPKPMGEAGCGFQGWVDESAPSNQSNGRSGPSRKRAPAGTINETSTSRPRVIESSNNDERRCGCNLEANRRLVSKDGPNKGRAFWCCSKVSKTAQCNFFEWDDEMGRDSGPIAGPSGTTGTGNGNACFKCGQEGHWSNACPNPQARASVQNSNYTCFSCNQPGHLSTSCPKLQSGSGGSRAQESRDASGGGCFHCGQTGHWATSCPSKNDQGEGQSASTRGTRRKATRGVKKRGRGRGSATGTRTRGRSKQARGDQFDGTDEYG